jgi:MipA family protein
VLQKIAFFIIFLIANSTAVDALENADHQKTTNNDLNTMHVEESTAWEFGIAVGIGQRDNVLVNSEDTNINAFFHIAYLGDSFFFDNGDFGYYLTNKENWNMSVIAAPNSERQIFDHLNGFNFGSFSTSGSSDSAEPVDSGTINEVLPEISLEPAKRDKTIDLGLELIGDGNWGELQLQVNTDLSNKHNGFEFWSGYSYQFKIGSFNIKPSFGAIYKSKQWTNYFYGVTEDEAILLPNDDGYIRPPYKPDSALNHFYKLVMSYSLTESLAIVAVFENEGLAKSIKKSPIVNQMQKKTQFIGLFYEF